MGGVELVGERTFLEPDRKVERRSIVEEMKRDQVRCFPIQGGLVRSLNDVW